MKHSYSQPLNNNNSSGTFSMRTSMLMNSLNARDNIPEHVQMKIVADADTLVCPHHPARKHRPAAESLG